MEYRITKSWNSVLAKFPQHSTDTYFTEQYIGLYEDAFQERECFVCESDDNVLLFPYLRRRFEFDGMEYSDFETAYGYGGPIVKSDDPDFAEKALKLFFDYCREQKFVSGFVRFHPLLMNDINYDKIGRVLYDRATVATNLEMSEEEIWMNELTSKNRSTVKKAAKSLRFVADYNFEYLDNFIDLYEHTMDKLGADEFYKFDHSYYFKWKATMPQSFLGVVLLGEQVVSAAIFFYSADYGHYHLSGSNREYLSLSPNNLLLWEAAKELKTKGVKKFHLGGGSTGDLNNSLLEFKSRFSKSRYEFRIGKTIFDQQVYDRICADWERRNPEKAVSLKNHLLKYKY